MNKKDFKALIKDCPDATHVSLQEIGQGKSLITQILLIMPNRSVEIKQIKGWSKGTSVQAAFAKYTEWFNNHSDRIIELMSEKAILETRLWNIKQQLKKLQNNETYSRQRISSVSQMPLQSRRG